MKALCWVSKMSSDFRTTSQILYDRRGYLLYVSNVLPPYKTEDIIDQPGWFGMSGIDSLACQAAILRLLNGGPPETLDVDVENIGRWRMDLTACNVGKVRIICFASQIPAGVLELTNRQIEICRLLAKGLSSKEIGHHLDCARATVDNHRANITKRLGIRPRELMPWCGANAEWF